MPTRILKKASSFLFYPNSIGLVYSCYRILLSFLLIIGWHWAHPDIEASGLDLIPLFLPTAGTYFALSIVLYSFYRFYPYYSNLQLTIGLLTDFFILTTFTLIVGGPDLQFSMLYLVVVIASNLLVNRRASILLNGSAILLILLQQFVLKYSNVFDPTNTASGLILVSAILGGATLTRQLVGRLTTMENVAEEQAGRVEYLKLINRQVVEYLQSGIIVIDRQMNIVLANQAAQKILKTRIIVDESLFSLNEAFANTIQSAIQQELSMVEAETEPYIQRQKLEVQLVYLTATPHLPSILLVIENRDRVARQAQQLKLASLGQLTASIAHEIRNPLAAINQASELLQESSIDEDQAELTRIIFNQGKRVNRIIEDILKLSRKSKNEQDKIHLKSFINEFIVSYFSNESVNIDIAESLVVYFDPSQLQQILQNLIQNGIYHRNKFGVKNPIQVIASSYLENTVMLDVINEGKCIDAETSSRIFEPFFTTEKEGTGLGLYLSRALCEANGGQLYNVPIPIGACFRLALPVKPLPLE